VRTLIIGAVTCASLLLAPAPADAREVNGCATPVAHRGVTQGTVQNTMKAFRAAVDRGVGFETDLRTTRDGYVVLNHNQSVNKTTNGRGLVADLTLRQIRKFRTDDGQQVPRLNQALALVAHNPGARITLDLKALTPHAQGLVAQGIAQRGIADRVRVISFRIPLLLDFKAFNPTVHEALIFNHLPTLDEVAPFGGAQVPAALITTEWTTQMNAAGFDAGVRDTDDPAQWQVAHDVGADRLLTDDIDGYESWCSTQTTPAA
jgi:glycerophosphoryl diester phosphodiesterase